MPQKAYFNDVLHPGLVRVPNPVGQMSKSESAKFSKDGQICFGLMQGGHVPDAR